LDPKKLDECIEATSEGASYRRTARHRGSKWRLKRSTSRRDKVLDGLKNEKAQLLKDMHGLEEDQSIDARITEFCEGARARFAQCTDFAAKRQFLEEHIQRIIYRRSKVTILGSLSIGPLNAIATSKLTFLIEGEIDKTKVRS